MEVLSPTSNSGGMKPILHAALYNILAELYYIYSGASEKRTLRDIASVPCREVIPISEVVLY